jgi:hypothetical protein
MWRFEVPVVDGMRVASVSGVRRALGLVNLTGREVRG